MGERCEIEFLEIVMSNSENISLWKKKAEIDYIPLFMSLWLSLNAWMRDRFNVDKDREILNLLKSSDGQLKDRFSELIHQSNAESLRFKGNFSELCRALDNADIRYTKEQWKNKKVSFENCIIDWANGSPQFTSILKTKHQQSKIQIDDGLWVEDDNAHIFAAYIEILYQVRCALFHGDLPPKPENERVVKALYLTLSMVMEKV